MSSGRQSYDKYLSIFSPDGRLYQIEYAFNSIRSPSLTCIALRGKGCAIVVSQKKVPDRLLKPDSVSHVFPITDLIGAAIVGRISDGRAQIQKARQEAADFEHENGFPIPVEQLARRMGDLAQTHTQYAGMRPMGVALIFLGMDQKDSGEVVPQVYKTDPAGFFIGHYGLAVGQKETEAVGHLEKKFKAKKFEEMGLEELSCLGINCLQSTLGSDFKAAELEVGVVTEEKPKFHMMEEDMIERILTDIAEKE